jgi:hypothetical protein
MSLRQQVLRFLDFEYVRGDLHPTPLTKGNPYLRVMAFRFVRFGT